MAVRIWLLFSSLSGFLAVVLGAFGAHMLRRSLPTEALAWWHTAVEYQMFHTLALMGVALLLERAGENRWLRLAGWSFVMGIVLFSGSLYLLALTGQYWTLWLTPFGGLALSLGWFWLLVAAFKFRRF